MRARMAIRYSGIAVELREVVLRDKPDEMTAISPKGTVPVLRLPDGTVIDESLDVMTWSLSQSDPDGWLDAYSPEIVTLIARNDDEFKIWLDKYKYADRFPERPAGEYRAEGERFLAELETRLEGQPYLCGSRITIADVALGPFVRQFAHVDQGWFAASPYPSLRTWLEDFTNSALFTGVMHKYPAWQAGDKPTVFG